MRAAVRRIIVAAAALLLAGCSTLDYYGHLARGQYALLAARRPIAELLAEPGLDPALRARLALALSARGFASARLLLPDNGSYRAYADLGRPWAVQNLFAAAELSLAPVEQCFPIAGCVAYRGYYDPARAAAEAARLQAQGFETFIGDVPAYSTLGWFDDPVLNTMLRYTDDELVGTIIHELAHQKVYLPGDTTFNESFATFVEQEGLRRWQAEHGGAASREAEARLRRAEQFTERVVHLREQLAAIYDGPLPDAAKREAKATAFAAFVTDYRALRDTQWGGYRGYDAFVDAGLNNASLLPFGLYHAAVPGFARLFAKAGGDFPTFYAAVEALAQRPDAERAEVLGLPPPPAEPD